MHICEMETKNNSFKQNIRLANKSLPFYRQFLNRRISVENDRPVANFFLFCSPEDGLSLCYACYSNYCIRDGKKYFLKNPNVFTST